MSPEQLAEAVRDTRFWLERFRGRTYEAAFRDYCEQFGPRYCAAVREAGEAGLAALAGALLDELERGWRRRRPWDRSAVKADEKQMLVVYLSPMLLQQAAGCEVLCEKLREAWNARWPGDAYRTVEASVLQKGFRTSIMGIELRRS